MGLGFDRMPSTQETKRHEKLPLGETARKSDLIAGQEFANFFESRKHSSNNSNLARSFSTIIANIRATPFPHCRAS